MYSFATWFGRRAGATYPITRHRNSVHRRPPWKARPPHGRVCHSGRPFPGRGTIVWPAVPRRPRLTVRPAGPCCKPPLVTPVSSGAVMQPSGRTWVGSGCGGEEGSLWRAAATSNTQLSNTSHLLVYYPENLTTLIEYKICKRRRSIIVDILAIGHSSNGETSWELINISQLFSTSILWHSCNHCWGWWYSKLGGIAMELTYPGSPKVINKIITIPAEAEVVAFSTHTSSSSNFIASITSGLMSGGSSGKGKRKYYYFYYYYYYTFLQSYLTDGQNCFEHSAYRGHHFLPLRHRDLPFSKTIHRPFITTRH